MQCVNYKGKRVVPALATRRDNHNQQLEFKLDTKACGKKGYLKTFQQNDFPVGKCAFHRIRMVHGNAGIQFNFFDQRTIQTYCFQKVKYICLDIVIFNVISPLRQFLFMGSFCFSILSMDEGNRAAVEWNAVRKRSQL